MILWPVIERELRGAARRRQTYWRRFGAAGAGFAVCAWALWDGRFLDQSRLGSDVFEAVSFVILILTLVAGTVQTADAISEEHREGTLGLLFLTDLKSWHVAAGKFFANSISSFLALAATIPVLAIPFLLGGVTGLEMARMALILSASLFLSLAIGLLASCLARDDRFTRAWSLLLILPFLVFWHPRTMFNIFAGWSAVSDRNYARTPEMFWINVVSFAAAGIAFLIGASFVARRLWREQPGGLARETWRKRWRDWTRGKPDVRAARRAARLDRNPMEWLAMRGDYAGAFTFGLLAIGAIVAIADSMRRNGPVEEGVALIISMASHWVVKIAVALAAGGLLAQASRHGALELILTTPLSARAGLEGQLIGLLRVFAPALAVAIAMDLLFIAFVKYHFPVSERDFKSFLLVRIALLFTDIAAIAFYALWSGLRSGRSGRAALAAFWWVVLAPDLFVLICIISRVGGGPAFFVTVWMVWDIAVIGRTLPDLLHLRERVSEGFGPSSSPA